MQGLSLLLIGLSIVSPVGGLLKGPSSQFISRENACTFKGDDNMYGLGIRLGLYFQWMTTSTANNFVPEEAATMRGVNNSFQLATFIALVYTTVTRLLSTESGPLYAVEAFIVFTLCAGGVCSGRGSGNSLERSKMAPQATSTSFAHYRETQIGQLIRVLIGSAIVYYGIWLIYSGLDSMAHPPCSRSAFFFAMVDLYHWFRTLLKVTFTIAAVYASAMLLSTLYLVAVLCHKLGFVSGVGSILGFNRDQPSAAPDTGTDSSGRNMTMLTNTSFSLELPVFVLMIELMIKWNKIEGVNTIRNTGQLIPLVVGASGLVRVLYKALYKAARGEYRKISDLNIC